MNNEVNNQNVKIICKKGEKIFGFFENKKEQKLFENFNFIFEKTEIINNKLK